MPHFFSPYLSEEEDYYTYQILASSALFMKVAQIVIYITTPHTAYGPVTPSCLVKKDYTSVMECTLRRYTHVYSRDT